MKLPRAVRAPSVCLLAIVGLGALAGCAQVGPPPWTTPVDGSTEVCAPAEIGEPFVVAFNLVTPRDVVPEVTDINFESAEGVTFTGKYAFTTDDGHGYMLYPLALLQAEEPASWLARQAVPTTEPLRMFDGAQAPDGTKQSTVTIAAIAERSGDDSGSIAHVRVSFDAGGRRYEEVQPTTFILSALPCGASVESARGAGG